MAHYVYVCQKGEIIHVIASCWLDEKTTPCPIHSDCFIAGFAKESAPYISPDNFWDGIRVEGLKDPKTGSDNYTSRDRYNESMYVNHKIHDEAGLDKDIENNRIYIEEANRARCAKKLEKFVHEMGPAEVEKAASLLPAEGDAVAVGR